LATTDIILFQLFGDLFSTTLFFPSPSCRRLSRGWLPPFFPPYPPSWKIALLGFLTNTGAFSLRFFFSPANFSTAIPSFPFHLQRLSPTLTSPHPFSGPLQHPIRQSFIWFSSQSLRGKRPYTVPRGCSRSFFVFRGLSLPRDQAFLPWWMPPDKVLEPLESSTCYYSALLFRGVTPAR